MNGTRSLGAHQLASRLQSLLGLAVVRPPESSNAIAASAARLDVKAGAALPPLPEYIEHALARMSLLHDVPFSYLVPDSRLLPPESIRFFTIDPAWKDALIQGALSVGRSSQERALAHHVLPRASRGAVKNLPFVRSVARGKVALEVLSSEILNTEHAPLVGFPSSDATSAETTISGFLLCSALVSSWPGLSVRAWATDDEAVIVPYADPAQLEKDHPELVVPVLRLDRLAPTVLLALFPNLPRLVWLEEPYHGVQFGLNPQGMGWEIDLRDEQGQVLQNQTVIVPMRRGSVDGVIDIDALAKAIDEQRPLAHPRGSAGLAMQLLQSPARQRFTASVAEESNN